MKMDKKTLALSVPGIILLASLALNVKSCSTDKKQDRKISDLENADSALRHTDSELFDNDDILFRNDSILNRRTQDLRADLDSLQARVDSCCDCNKPVKPSKPSKPSKPGNSNKPGVMPDSNVHSGNGQSQSQQVIVVVGGDNSGYVAPRDEQRTVVIVNGDTISNTTQVIHELNAEVKTWVETTRQRIR